jgi:hypothetical protein
MVQGTHRSTACGIAVAMLMALLATPVVAQPADEVTVAAGVNADTVDGKHAIKSTGDKNKRKDKLMAFAASGYLPSNIVKGGIATLAALKSAVGAVNEADNPVHWNQLQGVPGGIADGVDNEGITAIKLTRVQGSSVTVAAATPVNVYEASASIPCPPGATVTGGGAFSSSRYMNITTSCPADAATWLVFVTNTDQTSSHTFNAYAICMSIEPAGALTTARKGGLLPAKLDKRTKPGR